MSTRRATPARYSMGDASRSTLSPSPYGRFRLQGLTAPVLLFRMGMTGYQYSVTRYSLRFLIVAVTSPFRRAGYVTRSPVERDRSSVPLPYLRFSLPQKYNGTSPWDRVLDYLGQTERHRRSWLELGDRSLLILPESPNFVRLNRQQIS